VITGPTHTNVNDFRAVLVLWRGQAWDAKVNATAAKVLRLTTTVSWGVVAKLGPHFRGWCCLGYDDADRPTADRARGQ